MFKIALCDDEIDESLQLQKYIFDYSAKHDYDVSFEIFISGDELLKSNCDFDLFFVDYQMPGINGIELTRKLKEEKHTAAEVIFLTAYSTFISNEGYEVGVFRMLSKPVNLQKLYEALDSIFEPISSAKPIKLKREGYTHIVYQRDIAYIEASEKQSVLCVKNELKTFNKLLKEIEAELSPDLFFRVGKSFIVNFKYIESYNSKYVIMKNGCKIPIGKEYAKDFQAAFDRFIFKYII